MMKPLFSPKEEEEIVAAIRDAEAGSTGEIKVHLERKSDLAPLDRAKELFHILKMDQLKQDNGVLFYIDVEDRQFAVFGGKQIDEKTSERFWNDLVAQMQADFKEGHFAQGLKKAIQDVGKELKSTFPDLWGNATNEMDDDISKS